MRASRSLVAGGALIAGGAALALVGTFMPWLASGAVDRSSYELIDLIERLGFSSDGPIAIALRAWPVVPLLLVLSVVALWPVVPAAVQFTVWMVTVCYVGLITGAVLAAPDSTLFRTRYGVWTTLSGLVLLLIGVVSRVVERVNARRPGRPAPA